MATVETNRNVYVGHRYVPLILGEWVQTQTYEGLSIVLHMGDSYTSKKRVPVGVPISNEEYWVITGNYNGQIDQYRQDVNNFKEELTEKLEEIANQTFWIKNPPVPLVACKCDGVTDDSVPFQNLNDFLAANGGGTMKLPRSTKEITVLNQEIILNSNVEIEGYGWNSKIKCNVGTSQNGNNILKAFEKANISLSKFTVENMGFGKSGAWEPAGTFDGAGACILGVGCDNFVVDRVMAFNGGGANGGEGVGNIYLSCCTNSKIIDNYVSLCDNGICVDSWYNQIVGKETFINNGVIIRGNTVTNGSGRGIVIENRSNLVEMGSIVVSGNTINKMAYAGIQGNNIFNCSITGNTIDGSQVGRAYGNGNYATWYGMEFVSGTSQAVITGNTIKNIKFNGIRGFEASDLTITGNNIKACEEHGIFIKNTNNDMINVKVDNNNLDVTSHGISITRDALSVKAMKYNSCSNNTVKFNAVGGSVGIDFQNQELGKSDGNIISPILTYGGSIGLRLTNSTKLTYNGNTIGYTTKGIDVANDIDSVSDSNMLEGCTSAYRLDNCQRTSINSKIRGGTTAFELVNGKTSTSQKCRSFNSDIDGTTNIKTGTGLIVWTTSSGIPTGTFETGDRVRNDTPTVGGVSEWVYVSGTFRPVGITS